MRTSRLLCLFVILALLFACLAYLVSTFIVLRGVDNIERLQAIQSMEHMRERLALTESRLEWQVHSIASSSSLHSQIKAKNRSFLSEK
ncbi:MAG: hypothetical protein J5803_03995, partial [Desulfovibrio sp.]|nr:hypothetical protein [Desulfovibrio sp.]